jgi:hypothetical protein
MNAIVQMRMFDMVMTHAYNAQKPKNFKGVTIPQDEFKKFENARNYALYLHRLNLLEPFYKRIMEGKV